MTRNQQITCLQQLSDKYPLSHLSKSAFPKAFAIPEFFTSNLVHPQRVIKNFSGDFALIEAFYFGYLKLTFQMESKEESKQYRQLLKEIFIKSYKQIEQGQLSDSFLSDFQYRKFFKDFLECIEKRTNSGMSVSFEQEVERNPIIVKIISKLFQALVPMGLIYAQASSSQSLFETLDSDKCAEKEEKVIGSILEFLTEKFQIGLEEIVFETQNGEINSSYGQCFRFESSQEIYLFVEEKNEAYVAFVDQGQIGQESLLESSFVCGEGNSFTSKFLKKTKSPQVKKNDYHQVSEDQKTSRSDWSRTQKNQSQYFTQPSNGTKIGAAQTKARFWKSKGTKERYLTVQSEDRVKEQLNQSVEKLNKSSDEKFNTLIHILDSSNNLSRTEGYQLDKKSNERTKQQMKSIFIEISKEKNQEELPEEILEEHAQLSSDSQIVRADDLSQEENSSEQPLAYTCVSHSLNCSRTLSINPTFTHTEMELIPELVGEDEQEFTEKIIEEELCDEELLNSEEFLTEEILANMKADQIFSENQIVSKTSIRKTLTSNAQSHSHPIQQNLEELAENQRQCAEISFFDQSHQKFDQQASDFTCGKPQSHYAFLEYLKSMGVKGLAQRFKQEGNVHSQIKNRSKEEWLQQRHPFSSLKRSGFQDQTNCEKKFEFNRQKKANQLDKKVTFHKIKVSSRESNMSLLQFSRVGLQKECLQFGEKQNFSMESISTNGDFTKSDILILLDEECRERIRNIKRDHKSRISQQKQQSVHPDKFNAQSLQ